MPFPSALSVVVAGSLAAQGQMSWHWAGAVVVTSSVLGDLAGYGLGRVLGREFFERRGRWLGLTPALRGRIEIFFQKWGALNVVLSRSLLSFKSSAVNLLAGASRYRLRLFIPFAIVGRLIWSSMYLSLGYGFGVAIEAAADFTSSLSGLLVSFGGSRRARIHDPPKSRTDLNRSTPASRLELDEESNSTSSSKRSISSRQIPFTLKEFQKFIRS